MARQPKKRLCQSWSCILSTHSPVSSSRRSTDTSLDTWVPYVADISGGDEDRVEGLEVHSANLHMHAFGHSGVITLTDDNGQTETLLSVPNWDLNGQRDFRFQEPKVFSREQLEGNLGSYAACPPLVHKRST